MTRRTLTARRRRTGRVIGVGGACLLATACFDPLIEDPGNTWSSPPPGLANPPGSGLPGPVASSSVLVPPATLPVAPGDPVTPGATNPDDVPPPSLPGATPPLTPPPNTPGAGGADAGAVPAETQDEQTSGTDAGGDLASSAESWSESGVDAGEEANAP